MLASHRNGGAFQWRAMPDQLQDLGEHSPLKVIKKIWSRSGKNLWSRNRNQTIISRMKPDYNYLLPNKHLTYCHRSLSLNHMYFLLNKCSDYCHKKFSLDFTYPSLNIYLAHCHNCFFTKDIHPHISKYLEYYHNLLFLNTYLLLNKYLTCRYMCSSFNNNYLLLKENLTYCHSYFYFAYTYSFLNKYLTYCHNCFSSDGTYLLLKKNLLFNKYLTCYHNWSSFKTYLLLKKNLKYRRNCFHFTGTYFLLNKYLTKYCTSLSLSVYNYLTHMSLECVLVVASHKLELPTPLITLIPYMYFQITNHFPSAMDNSQAENSIDEMYIGVLFEAEEERAWAREVLKEDDRRKEETARKEENVQGRAAGEVSQMRDVGWRRTCGRGRGGRPGEASPGVGPLRSGLLASMPCSGGFSGRRVVLREEDNPESLRTPQPTGGDEPTIERIEVDARDLSLAGVGADDSVVSHGIPGEEVLRRLKEAGGLPRGTFKTLGVSMEDVLKGRIIGVNKTGKWTERDVVFELREPDITGGPRYMVIVVRSDDHTTIRLHKGTIRLVPEEQVELIKSMADFHMEQTRALGVLAEGRRKAMLDHEAANSSNSSRSSGNKTRRRKSRRTKRSGESSGSNEEPQAKTPRNGNAAPVTSTPAPNMEVDPLTPIPRGGRGGRRELESSKESATEGEDLRGFLNDRKSGGSLLGVRELGGRSGTGSLSASGSEEMGGNVRGNVLSNTGSNAGTSDRGTVTATTTGPSRRQSEESGSSGQNGGHVQRPDAAAGPRAALPLPDLEDVPLPPEMTAEERTAMYRRQLEEVDKLLSSQATGTATGASRPPVRVEAGPRPEPRRKTKTYAEIVHERSSIKLEVYYTSKNLCDQADLLAVRDGVLEYQKRWARDMTNEDADMPTVDAMVMGGGAVRIAVPTESAAEQMRREIPNMPPAHPDRGHYQVWGPQSKPFHAYTLKMLGTHSEQDLKDTPFWIQRFNPALRSGLIRFNEVVKMRQPATGVHIVRLLVEDALTQTIDAKGGHLNGLGGPWYLEKRRSGEPLENEIHPPVLEMNNGAGSAEVEGMDINNGGQ